ncbi:MAG TPA: DsrE/DsrF/DrsH-like family protein [Nitrospirota bacterium]|nr:DsrE/DsrF/DrsH-like family protein [Nitrospirota bacterium]
MGSAGPTRAKLRAKRTRLSGTGAQRKKNASGSRLSIIFFSNDLDKAVAAFIIATGAAASGMQVDIFFTFWGLSVLRDPRKKTKKSFVGRMFGWMLPKGSDGLKLSKMHMAGMGTAMIRGLMKKQNVSSLPEMIETAGALGVRFHACTTSMDLMGIRCEELIDYPQMDAVGVTSFLGMATESKTTLFI